MCLCAPQVGSCAALGVCEVEAGRGDNSRSAVCACSWCWGAQERKNESERNVVRRMETTAQRESMMRERGKRKSSRRQACAFWYGPTNLIFASLLSRPPVLCFSLSLPLPYTNFHISLLKCCLICAFKINIIICLAGSTWARVRVYVCDSTHTHEDKSVWRNDRPIKTKEERESSKGNALSGD